MIERKTVEKLAALSRIALTEEEKDSFVDEIDAILGFVGQVEGVKVDSSVPNHILNNVFRADGEPHESGIFTDTLLKEAPETKDGFVKVKKILQQ